MTLADIIEELTKSGRDPREDMPKPVLRSDVLKLEDLKEGMILTGTVRNVIDFGAFVDIGVKYDGLVHISELSDKYVRNPSEVVSVGDVVKVKVIKIDMDRKKVSLSMRGVWILRFRLLIFSFFNQKLIKTNFSYNHVRNKPQITNTTSK